MSGNADGPAASDGDLTGTVTFTMGQGCGEYDFGYDADPGGGANTAPHGSVKVRPRWRYAKRPVRLSAKRSTDAETPGDLDYSWDLGNGGTTKDGTGSVLRARYAKPGRYTVRLTVTDPLGARDVVKKRVLVQRLTPCQGKAVTARGSWRVVRSRQAPGGSYCDNAGPGSGKDVLTATFKGSRLEVFHGRSLQGGSAKVFVDGELVGTVSFHNRSAQPTIRYHRLFKGLGRGTHHLRLVVTTGRAYLEGFGTLR
jgi:hypothetical protein